jgi:hypothetical protein
MAKIEDKKSEEIYSKSGPEAEGIEYIDYQFKVRCTKLPGGLTKACSIIDIRMIEPLKEDPTAKTAEASTGSPQKDTPVAEAVALKAVDGVQPEIKPGDLTCDLCDALANTLKEQVAKTTAKSTEAESAAAAPRWLHRQSPEVRHKRSLVKV